MKVRFSSPRKPEPDAEQGIKLPYAPSKRVASKMSWYLVLAIVCTPLLYVVLTAMGSVLIVSEPGHISLGKIEINSKASGEIAVLEVKVGDNVSKGDVLARLRDPRLAAESDRVSSEIELMLNSINRKSSQRDVDSIEQKLRLAIENRNFYVDQYEAMKTLFERRSATRADLNAARVTVQRAKLNVLDYQTQLAELRSTPQKTLKLTQLEAELRALQGREESLIQRAPAAGRVLDIFVRESEVVRVGDGLALIGEPDAAHAVAYIDPKYTRYARLGQTAVVKLPNGETVTAKISSLPEITHRLPSDFARPLGLRSMKILAHLELEDNLPQEAKVEGLPVSVRFPFSFAGSF